jgi:hypothetical protein
MILLIVSFIPLISQSNEKASIVTDAEMQAAAELHKATNVCIVVCVCFSVLFIL